MAQRREITFYACNGRNDLGHRGLHPGVTGQRHGGNLFFFQFGMTISTAVGFSLLEAITLTPMRCSQFLTAKEDESRFTVWVNRIFANFSNNYRRVLTFSLKPNIAGRSS